MRPSRQALMGAFLVGGIALFAIGLFWIGDRRQMFHESIELYAEFANLSGLSKGAKVRVSGLDAGEVLEIQVPPDPESRFRVRFRSLSKFKTILRADSVASIQNDGLVGNKFLQVGLGTAAAAHLAPGDTIRSREPIEISDLLFQVQETVKTANGAINDIRVGIDSTVKTVANLTEQTSQIVTDVALQVNKVATTGAAITEDARAIVAKARNGEGALGRFLNDDEIYVRAVAAVKEGEQLTQQVKAVTDDLRAIVARTRNGEGSLGRFLKDDEVYDQVVQIIKDGQKMTANFKTVSDDLKAISDDLKSRDLGEKVDTVAVKIDRIAGNLDDVTREAAKAIRSFAGPDGATGGLMEEVRQTLSSTNETMANFADSSEALKHNFLFKGFFNDRGFFDLDAVTVSDYRAGRFLPERQKVTQWLDATQLFSIAPDGKERMTADGRHRLDIAMAGFLRYSKNEPLVVESWAGLGTEPERVLRARERAIAVSEHLVGKFALKPNLVAIMPMNAVAATDGQSKGGESKDGQPKDGQPKDGQPKDGVQLALFVEKPSRK